MCGCFVCLLCSDRLAGAPDEPGAAQGDSQCRQERLHHFVHQPAALQGACEAVTAACSKQWLQLPEGLPGATSHASSLFICLSGQPHKYNSWPAHRCLWCVLLMQCTGTSAFSPSSSSCFSFLVVTVHMHCCIVRAALCCQLGVLFGNPETTSGGKPPLSRQLCITIMLCCAAVLLLLLPGGRAVWQF